MIKSFQQLWEKLYAVGITVLPAHSNSSDLSQAIEFTRGSACSSLWPSTQIWGNYKVISNSPLQAALSGNISFVAEARDAQKSQHGLYFCICIWVCKQWEGRNRDQAWRFPPGAPEPAETTAAKNAALPHWTMSALHADTPPHTTGVDWWLTWMFKTCMQRHTRTEASTLTSSSSLPLTLNDFCGQSVVFLLASSFLH